MADKFHCLDCEAEFGEPEAEPTNYRCPDCGSELFVDQADASTNKRGLSKISFAIFAPLCLAAVFYFVWQPGNDNSEKAAQAVDKIFNKALEVNSKVPMMIDNSTRLDQVVVEGETIIYKTTLVNLTSETAEKSVFKKKIGPFLAEKYCNDKNSRSALELGVKYGHEYSGNDGVLLYTANISVDDC